jgi:NAD(P)-dependent dehydrogenase (short-subunit alcohol dehydrogenase family)
MSALPDLRGRVAVVTGGASGIGMGIARQLIAEDMQVVIGDIEAGPLRKTADDLGAVGILTDVSDLESVRALARSAAERFGTVHVVCNNAGVGPLAAIADLTMADWHWIIGVNLYGVIHGVQTFLPILQANEDGGHIVNTASMAGLVARPRLGAYSVTKLSDRVRYRTARRRKAREAGRVLPGDRVESAAWTWLRSPRSPRNSRPVSLASHGPRWRRSGQMARRAPGSCTRSGRITSAGSPRPAAVSRSARSNASPGSA